MLTPEQRTELADRRARAAMQIGYCVPAFAWPGPDLFRVPNVDHIENVDVIGNARIADRMGFDSIWVCDHLILGRDKAVYEGWTMLAMIAGATEKARLGLIHQANLFRTPAIAAKMMSTLDRLSGGRFIHFFEAGMGRPEQVAYGLDWDDNHAARVERLEEAIDLIEALYASTSPIDFNGKFYHLAEASLAPKPLQQHIPLWLGEAFDPVIELTGRRADGWNTTPVTLTELSRRLGLVDASLAKAGRDRSGVEISFETQILVAPDTAGLRRKLKDMVERSEAAGAGAPKPEIADFVAGRTDTLPDYLTGPWIVGTVAEARERLSALRAQGVDHLMLWFMDAPDTDGMELFLGEVAEGYR